MSWAAPEALGAFGFAVVLVGGAWLVSRRIARCADTGLESRLPNEAKAAGRNRSAGGADSDQRPAHVTSNTHDDGVTSR